MWVQLHLNGDNPFLGWGLGGEGKAGIAVLRIRTRSEIGSMNTSHTWLRKSLY